MDLSELLAFAVKNGASDIHISAGLPPLIRIDGDIRRIKVDPLASNLVHDMIYDIMLDSQRKEFEERWETDFAFEIPNVARFRVNAFNQARGPGAAFRTIPTEVLTLEAINAPAIFRTLSDKHRGLVLVTGPTGSGKSTTLAAMIDYINHNKKGHILTIEDPIEFVHQSHSCLVNQRDVETISLALTAAETGHLVFGTLHTSSAAKTIDRIIDVFPAGEKEMVRAMLSESLQGVIAQRLLKRPEGGRAAAYEIMIGTPAIRNLIREAKVPQIYGMIQTGREAGMITMDQSLENLVSQGVVDRETALALAVDQTKFSDS
jgi:twitching motility protein PilT